MTAKLYVAVAACVISARVAAAFPPYDAESEHDGAGEYPRHGGAPMTYHFQYAVHDPLTGDKKSQNEVSDGHGGVKGTYSVLEADGSTRVVEYTADDEHGFRAEVKKIQPLHKDDAPQYKFDAPEYKHHALDFKYDFAEFKAPASPAPVHSEDEHHLPELFTPH